MLNVTCSLPSLICLTPPLDVDFESPILELVLQALPRFGLAHLFALEAFPEKWCERFSDRRFEFS